MRDFSIELESEKIQSDKTKEYFQEVIKSYYNENYRSAVVMLYTVTLTDIVLKLITLKETFNDANAIGIINAIETLQQQKPNSPEWESKLIELIKDQTNFLEVADHLNLTNLQKHRHLCAHPIITQNYELYSPNKETVRAHIRNMLEGVLTKPALLSKKIFDELLEDISSKKSIFMQDKDLERYLTSKYLKNMNITVEKQIFKSLWKITFSIDEVKCNENRQVNFQTLMIIFNRNYDQLILEISKEKTYYSKVEKKAVEELVLLIGSYPKVYDLLTEDYKLILQSDVGMKPNLIALAWFLNKSISHHVKFILSEDFSRSSRNKMHISTIYHLADKLLDNGNQAEAHDFLIRCFIESNDFNTADWRFNTIHDKLEHFSEEEFKKLLEGIEDNNQIYYRNEAHTTNAIIKTTIDSKFPSFDYKGYVNFLTSIKRKI